LSYAHHYNIRIKDKENFFKLLGENERSDEIWKKLEILGEYKLKRR